ncbi:MAG: outer membrane protein assembly factor, partial [Phascolarctobacterium sp.]|nr:outer membrane protein assembly factor [Phascolarctobacterium sp.]
MKKRFLLQPLTVGLAAALFAVPVFAQEQSEVAQNAAVLVEAANVGVPQAEPVEEVVQAQPENKLAQYLGKTITKQSVVGNTVLSEEEVLAVVKTKPGMELTEIGLSEDLGAIYDMGWFYDLRPEFKEVPEGVQVVYHVLENPTYSKLNFVGSTVINKQKVNALFNLEEGSVVNLKDINRRVLKLEEEYRQAGYILARVTDVHMDQDGTLNLTVNEGIVEDFKVKGNVKTKDYVITREMRLKKGQPFNAKDARRSMQ